MAIPCAAAAARAAVVSGLTQQLQDEESLFSLSRKTPQAVTSYTLSSCSSTSSFGSFSSTGKGFSAGSVGINSRAVSPLLALAASLDTPRQQDGDGLATSEKKKSTTYHFLVANAKFMLDEEEHFQELMKERLRNFGERGREQDFWLVVEPQFLDRFPDISKRLGRPAVALVSTDVLWITFMKLRLDRVLRGEFEADSLREALKSNPVELNFDKPEKWSAPYTKYEGDWWTPFLPPSSQ